MRSQQLHVAGGGWRWRGQQGAVWGEFQHAKNNNNNNQRNISWMEEIKGEGTSKEEVNTN